MKRIEITELLNNGSNYLGKTVNVKGWVRAFRSNRFIQMNDGSCMGNIQAVIDFENIEESILKRVTTGASISVFGELVKSQGSGQAFEVQAMELSVIGDAHPDDVQKTVLQPKRHSLGFKLLVNH